MRKLVKTVLFCISLINLLQLDILAEESILGRVVELQKTARRANGGALGCGIGNFKLHIGKEVKTITSGLDPIHVFGKEINIKDLKAILKSRVDSYTNKKSPMNGEFSDLCYITLDTIKDGLDPTTIPIVEALLQDPSGTIKDWAAISLLYMAENDNDLKEKIKDISFPEGVINEAKARGVKIPQWVKIVSDK